MDYEITWTDLLQWLYFITASRSNSVSSFTDCMARHATLYTCSNATENTRVQSMRGVGQYFWPLLFSLLFVYIVYVSLGLEEKKRIRSLNSKNYFFLVWILVLLFQCLKGYEISYPKGQSSSYGCYNNVQQKHFPRHYSTPNIWNSEGHCSHISHLVFTLGLGDMA